MGHEDAGLVYKLQRRDEDAAIRPTNMWSNEKDDFKKSEADKNVTDGC